MPALDVAAPGLDHAVGVEQHGVAAVQATAHRQELGALDDPERRALGLVHQPAAGAGPQLGGRRVAGGADLEVAGLQVDGDVDRGREPLDPVLAQEVLVGGGQELGGRQRARAGRRRRR